MSPAMRDALQALAQPTDPTAELAREELARRRARLDVRGLLGLCADVALQHDVRDAVRAFECATTREGLRAA